MTIFICIIKTILGYFILMFAGTNLLGLIVRGLTPTYRKDENENLIMVENIPSSKSIITTIIFSFIGILYFFALYHYWNIGIAIAGAIMMFTTLPDLLFEMRTGEKISSNNMSKRPIDIFCTAISWIALPLIWYSLCYLN